MRNNATDTDKLPASPTKKKRNRQPRARVVDMSAHPLTAIDEGQAAFVAGIERITATQMRHRGEFAPHYVVGNRTIRYRLGEVLAWCASRTVGKVTP
jgi:hypothetical protein